MTDNRKQIRPLINTEPTTSSRAEQFQNETLRPVLKLQNELVVAIFKAMMEKRKVALERLTPEQLKAEIQHRLSRDNKLRYLLLGAVIGQFTVEEYATYQSMEGEAKRRIFSMLMERLFDQLSSSLGE